MTAGFLLCLILGRAAGCRAGQGAAASARPRRIVWADCLCFAFCRSPLLRFPRRRRCDPDGWRNGRQEKRAAGWPPMPAPRVGALQKKAPARQMPSRYGRLPRTRTNNRQRPANPCKHARWAALSAGSHRLARSAMRPGLPQKKYHDGCQAAAGRVSLSRYPSPPTRAAEGPLPSPSCASRSFIAAAASSLSTRSSAQASCSARSGGRCRTVSRNSRATQYFS